MLKSDGTVYACGSNGVGELGDGTTTQRNVPVEVLKGDYPGTTYLGDDPGNKIIAIAEGNTYSIALAQDGTVYAWGSNRYGQLGNDSTADSHIPVKVLEGAYSGTTYLGDNSSNKIISIACGYYHSIALAQDGTVYAWGYNYFGQLRNNSTTESEIPVATQVSGGALPVEISSLTILVNGSNVNLKWQTSTEVNNYGFEVQRTIKNSKLKIQSFEKIGFVKGSGNSNSPKNYSFKDDNPPSGTVEYRLKQVDNNGNFKYSQIVTVNSLPTKFELLQNYPNPFNPTTTIQYAIPKAEHVTLKVYDELGKEVAALVNENKDAGQYNVQLAADKYQLSSGVYFYRITAGSFSEVKKLMFLK